MLDTMRIPENPKTTLDAPSSVTLRSLDVRKREQRCSGDPIKSTTKVYRLVVDFREQSSKQDVRVLTSTSNSTYWYPSLVRFCELTSVNL